MKAMVFAAGLGTRLRPLTDTLPKALVPVDGQPMLAHVLQRLKAFGCDDIIINVHHYADQIIAFLEQQQHFGIAIHISHEREQPLDTGGGVKQAAWFFDDGQPFLAHNVDVITNLDLAALYQAHLRSQALATIAVKSRQTARYFLFDQHDRLCGWRNRATGEVRMARPTAASQLTPLAFSGIHVISPAIFSLMPSQPVFSLPSCYLSLAAAHTIMAFRHDQSFWLDIGKPDALAQADRLLENSVRPVVNRELLHPRSNSPLERPSTCDNVTLG
jgi:NDP-sugar pyrophosphorylase family protein